MPDIYHDLPVSAPVEKVFRAVSAPDGLDAWWTRRSSGAPRIGETYQLWFAPEYDWRGRITHCNENDSIEWEITKAGEDWVGTRFGFKLLPRKDYTEVRFYHTGWPDLNDHYRSSCYCWAMYLRVMKAHVEEGKTVPYEKRLDAEI